MAMAMRRELSVDVGKLLEDSEGAGLHMSLLSHWGGLQRTIRERT